MNQEKSRAKNGNGHTYPYRNGYRTSIREDGRVITATGKTAAESRRKAKAKVKALQPLNKGLIEKGGLLKVNEFVIPWLKEKHQQGYDSISGIRVKSKRKQHALPPNAIKWGNC